MARTMLWVFAFCSLGTVALNAFIGFLGPSAVDKPKEKYFIPGIRLADLDKNDCSWWRQYALPKASTARRPRPQWREFETEQDALLAIQCHRLKKFSMATTLDPTVATPYGMQIEQDYVKAHQEFASDSQERRAYYRNLALLGLCVTVCGGVVSFLNNRTSIRVSAALSAVHGFYSFCCNVSNFLSVRGKYTFVCNMISKEPKIIRDELYDDRMTLEQECQKKDLKNFASIGVCGYCWCARNTAAYVIRR